MVVGIGTYYFMTGNNSRVTPSYTPVVTDSQGMETIVPTTQPSTAPTSTPVVSVSSTPKPAATASITVNISNYSFNPATLNIKTGTKVTWVNNDSAPHTVTSDLGNLLNSPTLASGQSFSFTFATSGTVNYHCAIHPGMKGSVVVSN